MIEHNNISHEDFVSGISKGTIRFEVIQKRNFSRLFFDPFVSLLFTVLLVLLVSPIIGVPVVSLVLHQWEMLFGFGGLLLGLSFHGFTTGSRKPIRNFVRLALSASILTLLLMYYLGPLHVISFVAVCALYQYFFLEASDNLYDAIAKKNLIRDSDRYYYAIENSIIKTFLVAAEYDERPD